MSYNYRVIVHVEEINAHSGCNSTSKNPQGAVFHAKPSETNVIKSVSAKECIQKFTNTEPNILIERDHYPPKIR